MKHLLLSLLLSIFLVLDAQAFKCEDKKIIKTYSPVYAKTFTIYEYDQFKIIQNLKDKVIVYDGKLNCETSLPHFKINSKRIVLTSTTHLPFLTLNGFEDFLVGFQGVKYIYNKNFHSEKIKEISFDLNAEELLSLKPDLIVAYPENLRRPERLNELRSLKLPVILNNELEEIHPLARAEWIIFMSVFIGKQKEAEMHFQEVVKNYQKIQSEASKWKKTNVLVGDIKNGFWNTCGDESDLALLIKDAGGILSLYEWTKMTSKTQYLSLERVLGKNITPEVWLPQNTWMNQVMLKSDSRYKKFLNLPIYNNVNKLNSKGFNDYWEMGLARPDLLLLDLVKIFHPEKYINKELNWYKKI